MKTGALIAAAGKGQRMRGRVKKQFIPLQGMPLLFYALKTFEEFEGIEHIHLVLDGGDFEYCRREIIQKYGIKKVIQLVPGGDRRQDSVWNGLKAMDESACGHPLPPLEDRFASFGWAATTIDGHDMAAICEALDWATQQVEKPAVIVANTIKGKGVSFIEGQAGFHNAPVTEEQLAAALAELEANRQALEA